MLVPLEPEATVVARLRGSLDQWPQAKRFVIHSDWHPPFDELVSASEGFPACVYGAPMTDTCKEVAEGIVRRTVPRETLFVADGPWVFTSEALRDALARVAGRETQIAGLLAFCQQARVRVRALPRP